MKDLSQSQPEKVPNQKVGPNGILSRNPRTEPKIDEENVETNEFSNANEDEIPSMTHQDTDEWSVPGNDSDPGVETPQNDTTTENPTRRWL